jgi:hypothetical protein
LSPGRAYFMPFRWAILRAIRHRSTTIVK